MAQESISKALFYFTHPWGLLETIVYHTPKLWSDKAFLKIQYRTRLGLKLNLDNPKTFGEKIQWLKLYDRRPEYTIMVDKFKAKEYVAAKLGEEFIIPTLGVWDDPEKINFASLPDSFVLKVNHNSGLGMCICKDKSLIDIMKVKAELRKGLDQDYFQINREWPYRDVPRRIIAEQFINPGNGKQDLSDYKWYCFNGEPKFCQVIQDRNTHETIDFFDSQWNHQEFVGLYPPVVPNAKEKPSCPVNLETHLRIARELSKDMPFARIDLYDTGDKIYFGEITLYPASGFGYFRPKRFNEILGDMIVLPHS